MKRISQLWLLALIAGLNHVTYAAEETDAAKTEQAPSEGEASPAPAADDASKASESSESTSESSPSESDASSEAPKSEVAESSEKVEAESKADSKSTPAKKKKVKKSKKWKNKKKHVKSSHTATHFNQLPCPQQEALKKQIEAGMCAPVGGMSESATLVVSEGTPVAVTATLDCGPCQSKVASPVVEASSSK